MKNPLRMPPEVARAVVASSILAVAINVINPGAAVGSLVLLVLIACGVRWARLLLTFAYAFSAMLACFGAVWLAFNGWRVPAEDTVAFASVLLNAAALVLITHPAVKAWTQPDQTTAADAVQEPARAG